MKDTFTRAELLEALRIEPCHVTGQHDPNHTPHHVCSIQRAEAFSRVLELLGVKEEELPKALHEHCGWCHEVPSQEEYRIRNRELYEWAGVPIPPELAEPGSGAERFSDENVLKWLREIRSPSFRKIQHGTVWHAVVSKLVAQGKARWEDDDHTLAVATDP